MLRFASCDLVSNHVVFSCLFVRFSCPVALPGPEGWNDAAAHREGRISSSSKVRQIIFNGDLQAGETARHFSGRAARQGDGLLCDARSARAVRTESLDRFWTRPKMFFAQCFRGSRENPG